MSTNALKSDYHGDVKDAKANFGGNILVYIGWDHHLLFCASRAFPLQPEMPFAAIIENVMPEAFSQHPEYTQIDWSKAQWLLNNQPFTPDFNASIESQGFDHKSLLRFKTPELQGFAGAHV